MDVGYFRRWYGNFVITDNLALAPADFTPFSVVAPSDSRLPGGGGNTVSGLYNITPTALTRPPNNLLTFAKNYGDQVENWQGVDVNVTSRLRGGVLAQGGISTGRTLTDSCEIRAAVPETTVLNPYCRVETPYLTQVKLLGAYTIPRARRAGLGHVPERSGSAGRGQRRLYLGAGLGLARPAARRSRDGSR